MCHPPLCPAVRATLLAAAVATAAAPACGDPFALPAPSFQNVVDTVSLYALHGTDIRLPSGFRLEDAQAVRTDQVSTFDFAFDIDTAGNPVLLTSGPLDLPGQSGAQVTSLAFDSIALAPTGGYELDSAIVLDSGMVVFVQSRQITCSFGLPSFFYGKLEVLAIDTASGPNGRRLDLQILANRNCGYRGLAPGLPDN